MGCNPINYRYNPLINPSEIVLINQVNANDLGHHLARFPKDISEPGFLPFSHPDSYRLHRSKKPIVRRSGDTVVRLPKFFEIMLTVLGEKIINSTKRNMENMDLTYLSINPMVFSCSMCFSNQNHRHASALFPETRVRLPSARRSPKKTTGG